MWVYGCAGEVPSPAHPYTHTPMAVTLRRCPECRQLASADGCLCGDCVRERRLAEHGDGFGATPFRSPELAVGLALLLAVAVAAGLRAQVVAIERWPEWYLAQDPAGGVSPARLLGVSLLVAVPVALLFVAGTAPLVALFHAGPRLPVPNWIFPVRGRWLRYLLAALGPLLAVAAGPGLSPDWWTTLPGLWLCLVLGAWLVARRTA